MQAVGGAIGGVLALVLVVLGLILSVFWLLFPWLVYRLLKEIRQELKELNDTAKTASLIQLQRITENTSSAAHSSAKVAEAFENGAATVGRD